MFKSRWFGVPSISYKLLSPEGDGGGGGSSSGPESGGSTSSDANQNQQQSQQQSTDTKPVTFSSQADLDAVIEQRLARERKKFEADNEQKVRDKIRQEQEAEEATKQGNFKKLYEDEVKKREEAEKRAAALELDRLKAKVAAEHKLHPSLAERLRGTTEEELAEDAKALAKEFKVTETKDEGRKPKNGNSDAGKGANGSESSSSDGGGQSENNTGTKDKPRQRFAFEGPQDVPIPR